MCNLFYYLTTFPDIIEAYFRYSIPSRAIKNGLLAYSAINLRDFATDKHRTTDDTPYGGGPGMVMKLEPILAAIDHLSLPPKSAIIHLTPKGQLLSQSLLRDLSSFSPLVFLCGHYEGIDERIGLYSHYAVSIGDYVIGGGEISSLVVTDGIIRLIKEVVGNEESIIQDSFSENLLDHPQFTKPRLFDDTSVHETLISGNHEKIRIHRRKESLKWTLLLRPELIYQHSLSKEDFGLVQEILSECRENIQIIKDKENE